jgi:hypothetical protein
MVPRKTTKAQPKRMRIAQKGDTGLEVESGSNAATTPAPAENGHTPSFSQVQVRAYEIFIARGGVHGHDWADWFRAERELNGTAGS